MHKFKMSKLLAKKIEKCDSVTFDEFEKEAIQLNYTKTETYEKHKKNILKFIKSGIDNAQSVGKKIVNLVCRLLSKKMIMKFQLFKLLGLCIKVTLKSEHLVTFEELDGSTTYQVKADKISDEIEVGQIYQSPMVCTV